MPERTSSRVAGGLASVPARLRQRWREASGRLPTRADQVVLVQNRIFVLPSGRGWFVIAVVIILLLIGINYQLALAYVVAFLLGGLFQVALLATYRHLAGLVVRPGRSPLAREGEALVFTLTLSSPARAREGIRARFTAPPSAQVLATATIDLAADGSGHLELIVPAPKRGVYSLGRITLESRAPYGLIRAWSYVHFPWLGFVSPEPESPAPPLPFEPGDPARTAHARGYAHDPDGLREYVPGDSLRRVAWKQVAKSGQWYTRVGSGDAATELHIDWNALGMADPEARLRRIAAWIDRARHENRAFCLTLPNGALSMGRGAAQTHHAKLLLGAYPHRLEALDGVRL
ncbi:MAG: DUF58 domain-containing protein [Casimicrobiaceae bacterium]|nr:DUF58 domain-containing protein [Casimicrobiaceae bacterium]MCX8099491.1 DUF58 domain-containing protein [Casimicrobiaceae bacterium]MDW8312832.1 DUF58 domain-containing protein [Burkholderiales bacterium]